MTYDRTRSSCDREISGPIWVFSSAGSPTTTPSIPGATSSRNRSYTERWTRIRVRAQQSWPVLSRKAMGAAAAAASRSASAKTMLGLLPPSSRVTLFTRSAHLAMICLPTRVEPVNTIFATPGCSTSASPVTSPRPGSTWKRCSGIPASRASSARRSAVSGVVSAGLRMTALPAASAGARPHAAIGMGKFHGAITPMTPRGSRKVTSMPPATGIWRPESLSTPPAANSSRSRTLPASQRALPTVCPASRTSSWASSSMCPSTTAAKRRSSLARSAGAAAAQPRWAAAARATAASTSSRVAAGTTATISSVAGFKTSSASDTWWPLRCAVRGFPVVRWAPWARYRRSKERRSSQSVTAES